MVVGSPLLLLDDHDDHDDNAPRLKKRKENNTFKVASDSARGFRLAGAAKENHNSELYSIAWSSDLFLKSLDKPPDESGDCVGTMSGFVRCFATCGGNNLTLYEVEVHNSDRHGSLSCTTSPCSGFSSRQVYVDADENEDYYTCVFAGRGVGSPLSYGPLRRQENATVVIDSNTDHAEDEAKRGHLDEIHPQWNNYSDRDGPQLLLVAGEQGIIKVVDIIHRRLHLTLSGHGDAIYDLKVNPQNSWLLISASKDESIRLWNIMNATCIGIFSGHEGHKSSVLSVSWHPMGKMFVSSSMDATIKIWSLEVPHVQENVRKCLSISPKARIYRGRSDESHTTVKPVIEQLPIYSTTKMHLDYIDCVQFVGDLILSKSTKNVISLWKPVLDFSISRRHRNNVIHLRDFHLNKCNVWFIHFQTDAEYRFLACGNNVGEIKVWELDSMSPICRSKFTLNDPLCSSSVRMVSFCPEQDSIIAVCDDSTVWKWDLL